MSALNVVGRGIVSESPQADIRSMIAKPKTSEPIMTAGGQQKTWRCCFHVRNCMTKDVHFNNGVICDDRKAPFA